MAEPDDNEGGSASEKVIREAKKRFKECLDWESPFRRLFVDDIKFDAADPDNHWQWLDKLYNDRNGEDKPCLTINKTHQHNLQIINDGKQNKPAIKIIATGGAASYRSAQVYSDICRNIEYRSNAEVAYDTAYSFAVRGGIGYVRVVSEYDGDDTFDQSLFVRRVKDPMSVFLDPDISEVDGSDARFGFVFEDRPKDEVFAEYPKLKTRVESGTVPVGNADGWIAPNHIRIAEYYRKVTETDRLVLLTEPETMGDGTPNPKAGEQSLVKASKVPKQILDLAIKMPDTKMREIARQKVEWYKIVGDEIVDKRIGDDAIPIPYIPIARCIGEETVIEGKLDRKGHTRGMKDPQRMLNYNASAAVEYGALQGKQPWIASAESIEGYETYYSSANRINHAWMPYNPFDSEGKALPPPQRQAPPQSAPVYLDGFKLAQEQMMMSSGQYQAQTGEQENARSGKAINARQRQGDNATYHYTDNQAIMIRHVGKILIAWIPHVYDTKRVMLIRAENGKDQQITIDPEAKQAVQENEKKDPQTQEVEEVETIFNPNVGKYDVQADVGPGYATKRQEAFNALSQIAAQNDDAMNTIGDFLFQSMDVPFADEMAERYKRKIPANIKGEAPPPEVGELTMQLENMKSALADLIQQLAESNIELKRARDKGETDSHRAITERIKVLGAGVTPDQIASLVTQAVMNALQTQVPPESEPEPQMSAMNGMPTEGMPMQPMQPMQPGMQG